MKQLRFGIIGCGRISKKHIESLHAIENAELIAVCDKRKERAQETAEKYKVKAYSDYNEMLSKEKIDVVNILTESGLHGKTGIEVAEKYRCHLVIEKPMTLRINEAEDLIKICANRNLKLFVVKQNRYNLPVQKLKQAIETGRFGKIFLLTVRVRWCRDQKYYDQDKWRGTWEMDGGVFSNQASHHIDLLQWLGGTVDSVMAKSITALHKIEVEDTGAAILKFKNNALGIVEATTCARPRDIEGSLSVLGENGYVEIGGFAVNKIKAWEFAEKRPEDEEVMHKYSENPPNVYGYGHLRYLQDVVDCIINNTKIPVDGYEGLKTLELINAIYESIETEKNVNLHFIPKKCRLGLE